MKNILMFMAALVIGGTLMLQCSVAKADSAAGSVAGANSEQSQGQVQSNANALSNVGNSGVAFNNSFNQEGTKVPRDLPIPTAAGYTTTGGPAMFSPPRENDNGENFISMNNLIGVLNAIDLEEAVLEDEGDIQIVAQLINTVQDADVMSANSEMSIQFILNPETDVMKASQDFHPVAVVSIKADDNTTMNSATLAVKLALYGRSINAPKIVLIGEGVIKRLTSTGYGIGLSYNYASVGSALSDHGAVGAGGTGWSHGEAEYLSLPFLTAVLGY